MCQSKKSWWLPGNRVWEKEVENLSYFPLRFCVNCNNVWEIPFSFGQDTRVIYYKDFHTYGLTREFCNACEKGSKTKKRNTKKR